MISYFLSWPMAFSIALCGISQAIAHVAMYDGNKPLPRDRQELATDRLERYGVGVLIMLGWFAIGWWLQPTGDPVISLLGIVGSSGLCTYVCYRLGPKQEEPLPTGNNVIDRIWRELREDDVRESQPRNQRGE